MPTLTARQNKNKPLNISTTLLSQLIDLLEDTGHDVDEISDVRSVEPVTVDAQHAEEYAEGLRKLLDEDEIKCVRYCVYWQATQQARMVVHKDKSNAQIINLMQSKKRAHLYRSHLIDESNLISEDLPRDLENRIADTSAFMFVSKGFELSWM